MNRSGSSAAAVLLLTLVVAAIAVFYFGFYDTLEGRCSRGDIGACTVRQARAAAVLRAVGDAITTTAEPTAPSPTQPLPQLPDPCWIGVAGHDVLVEVSGSACFAFIAQVPGPLGVPWIQVAVGDRNSLRLICTAETQGYTADVFDDGGAAYATAACASLDAIGTVARP